MRKASRKHCIHRMAAAAVLAGVVSGATSGAQQAKPVIYSARSACRLVQTVLPLADELEDTRSVFKINEIWLTPLGFTASLQDGKVESLKYSDSPGVKPYGKGNSYQIDFFPARIFQFQRGFLLDFHEKSAAEIKLTSLVGALNFLITSAHQGEGVDCKTALDDQAQLDSFAQLTVGWRALYLKPPLPDEVMKLRLLAVDAVKRKNLSDALEDYLEGVDTDPTWAEGWFNAALVYGEQQDYDDAIYSMRHYLILLPDAPDAATAKEKLLLWKAKMHETAAAK